MDPIEQDPALLQEDTTATDPQVEEEEAEIPETETEESAEEGADTEDQEAKPPTDSEEIEILVEGEKPPAKKVTSHGLKELRKSQRDLSIENAELKRQLQARTQPATVADPGPKPTLDSCDFDAERFEKELDTWKDAAAKKKLADHKAAKEVQDHQRAWEEKRSAAARSREEYAKKIPDYMDAEAVVQGTLSEAQQGLIIRYAKNPVLVITVIGRNPERAKALAGEQDLVEFVAQIRELEARVKEQKKTNQTPAPERPVRGSGAVSGTSDSHLERLRTEAAKSGDYTKVHAYKRQKQAQA